MKEMLLIPGTSSLIAFLQRFFFVLETTRALLDCESSEELLDALLAPVLNREVFVEP
jgi:hypothetical protein